LVLGSILEKGARLIERNTLERSSFPFAARHAESVALSIADMCFVKHEDANNQEDFFIDAEPVPEPTDTWARMFLEKKPAPKPHGNSAGRGGGIRSPRSRRLGGYGDGMSETSSDAAGSMKERRSLLKAQRTPKGQREQSRSFPIVEDVPPISEWEDRLRAGKAKKRVEKLAQQAEEQRLAEAEAAKQLMWLRKVADEADKGPCTFDSNGNMIWVEELDVEQLPKACGMDYEVDRGDEPSKVLSQHNSKIGRSGDPRLLQERGKKKRGLGGRAHSAPGGKQTHKFTDGFHKPLGWQPPLWEIFSANKGVVMTCMGNVVEGPPSMEGTYTQMTRREYDAMVHDGVRPASAGGASVATQRSLDEATAFLLGAAGGTRPGSASQARPGTAPSPAGARIGSKAPSTAAPGERPRGSKDGEGGLSTVLEGSIEQSASVVLRMDPAAPGWQVRARQTEGSLGYRRGPRDRVAQLGSMRSVGPAHPPLGATMGHGLLRNADTRQGFYFPGDKLVKAAPCGDAAENKAGAQLKRAQSAGGICVRPGLRPGSGNAGASSRATSTATGCGPLGAAARSRPMSAASRPMSAVTLAPRR